jgi:hypothetical protein
MNLRSSFVLVRIADLKREKAWRYSKPFPNQAVSKLRPFYVMPSGGGGNQPSGDQPVDPVLCPSRRSMLALGTPVLA